MFRDNITLAETQPGTPHHRQECRIGVHAVPTGNQSTPEGWSHFASPFIDDFRSDVHLGVTYARIYIAKNIFPDVGASCKSFTDWSIQDVWKYFFPPVCCDSWTNPKHMSSWGWWLPASAACCSQSEKGKTEAQARCESQPVRAVAMRCNRKTNMLHRKMQKRTKKKPPLFGQMCQVFQEGVGNVKRVIRKETNSSVINETSY